MIYMITYGNQHFEQSKRRIEQEAIRTGWFDRVITYSPKDLPSWFVEKYRSVLNLPRGGGYWIWKYWICQQTLDQMSMGDILVYVDAGCTINPKGEKRFWEYMDMLSDERPHISFQTPYPEFKYTTNELFQHFGVSDNKDITETLQILSGVMMFKKNKESMQLLERCRQVLETDAYLFTDVYNRNAQRNGFVENRHDQSVFSILRKLQHTNRLPDETWFVPFGNPESVNYPFWATRKRV